MKKNYTFLKAKIKEHIKYGHEIKRINEFAQSLIVYYYQVNIHKKPTLEQMLEIKAIRERINLLSAEVEEYVHKVGISTSIPPSEFSEMLGKNKTFDLFENRFDFLPELQPPVLATDILEKAIGKYKYLQKKLLNKSFNPVIWVRELIRIPFHIITFAGFNGKKIEYSLFGKLWKLIVSLVVFFSAIFGAIASLDLILSKVFDFELLAFLKILITH